MLDVRFNGHDAGHTFTRRREDERCIAITGAASGICADSSPAAHTDDNSKVASAVTSDLMVILRFRLQQSEKDQLI